MKITIFPFIFGHQNPLGVRELMFAPYENFNDILYVNNKMVISLNQLESGRTEPTRLYISVIQNKLNNLIIILKYEVLEELTRE